MKKIVLLLIAMTSIAIHTNAQKSGVLKRGDYGWFDKAADPGDLAEGVLTGNPEDVKEFEKRSTIKYDPYISMVRQFVQHPDGLNESSIVSALSSSDWVKFPQGEMITTADNTGNWITREVYPNEGGWRHRRTGKLWFSGECANLVNTKLVYQEQETVRQPQRRPEPTTQLIERTITQERPEPTTQLIERTITQERPASGNITFNLTVSNNSSSTSTASDGWPSDGTNRVRPAVYEQAQALPAPAPAYVYTAYAQPQGTRVSTKPNWVEVANLVVGVADLGVDIVQLAKLNKLSNQGFNSGCGYCGRSNCRGSCQIPRQPNYCGNWGNYNYTNPIPQPLFQPLQYNYSSLNPTPSGIYSSPQQLLGR